MPPTEATADEIEERRRTKHREETLAEEPLFAGLAGDEVLDHILVIRNDPDDGTLGKLPAGSSELDVKARWGGGKYRVEGRTEKSKPIKGAHRTFQIAGDPLFESPAAENRWRRAQGLEQLPPKPGALAPAPPAATAPAFGVPEILAFLNSQSATQAAAAERRMTELDREHKQSLERMRLEAELREKDREAAEDRRQRAEEEREERRQRHEEDQRRRDREFQAQLAQLTRRDGSGASGIDTLIKGIEIARKIGGGDGGKSDPLQTLVETLPTILEKGRELMPGGAKTPPAAAAAAAAKSKQPVVQLVGDIAIRAQQAIDHFKKLGVDPEQALSNLLVAALHFGKGPGADVAPAAEHAANGAPPASPATTSA